MDNDLILPETDANDFVDPTPPPRKKTKNVVFSILAATAFIGLAVALVVVILDKDSKPEQTAGEDTSEEMSKYDSQEFNEAMSLAEERLNVKDYVRVQSYIKEYSLPEYMTLAQKYRYYSLLASLYSGAHLNDQELSSKYSTLADETLKSIRKGEE